MFTNNLKSALRLMRKNGSYSAINVLGLATGLSAVILMSLFIVDELSYDRFHKKGQQIIRLSYRLETPNATRRVAKLPFPIKQQLLANYSQVMQVARFYYWSGDSPIIEYGDQKNTEEGVYFADSEVFELFNFKFLKGNPATAFSDPRSIILTEKVAKKYFGDEDPMGQVIRYKNEDDLVVTGLIEDVPRNSHITFDILVPIELQRQRWLGWGTSTYDLEKDWNWAAAWTYVQVAPETNLEELVSALQAIANEHLNTPEQSGFYIEAQPLFDIHLNSDKSAEPGANGSMVQLYTFGAIAVLILLIACINFVNLAAAQANKRIKEVGLRKVLGARRHELLIQLLIESLMLVLISSITAVALAYVSLPYFNTFMNKSLAITATHIPYLLALTALVFTIAALSGLRPSIAAIRAGAIQGLSDKFNASKSNQRFNKSLVIGQFVVCNLLIIGILVIHNQLNFLQNKDLGFDKEGMLLLRHGRYLSLSEYDAFEVKLGQMSKVKNINRGYVAGTSSFTNTFKVVGDENEDTYSLGIKWVGKGFTDMFNLEVVAGINFKENGNADGTEVLINAAAAKALGWTPEESLGRRLSFKPGGARQPEEQLVIGVLADANFESLYDPVLPSIFKRPNNHVGGQVSIKLANTRDLAATIGEIEREWKEVKPDFPFEYSFLDQQIEAQYIKEERLASAINYFALLAIFIACMGLFALASFAAQQRTKEMGVRKVLGASVSSLFVLVCKNFLWLMVIAFVVSAPLAYYLFGLWLQDFAYRVNIGMEVFVIAAGGSFLVAILAVGSQSLKVANSDPVDTLRYE